jgi:hypothetical protein
MKYAHLAQPHLPYRETYRCQSEDLASRQGQPFTVLGEISTAKAGEIEGVDPAHFPMYKIRFPDGEETHAFPEEVRLDWYIPSDPEWDASEAAAARGELEVCDSCGDYIKPEDLTVRPELDVDGSTFHRWCDPVAVPVPS